MDGRNGRRDTRGKVSTRRRKERHLGEKRREAQCIGDRAGPGEGEARRRDGTRGREERKGRSEGESRRQKGNTRKRGRGVRERHRGAKRWRSHQNNSQSAAEAAATATMRAATTRVMERGARTGAREEEDVRRRRDCTQQEERSQGWCEHAQERRERHAASAGWTKNRQCGVREVHRKGTDAKQEVVTADQQAATARRRRAACAGIPGKKGRHAHKPTDQAL